MPDESHPGRLCVFYYNYFFFNRKNNEAVVWKEAQGRGRAGLLPARLMLPQKFVLSIYAEIFFFFKASACARLGSGL